MSPRKSLRVAANVYGTQLTIENMDIVEELCHGSIRGTKLPIGQRIVQFYNSYEDREYDLRMTDWLVEFHVRDADRTVLRQVWTDKAFRAVFQLTGFEG